jgi:hypothetical protein
VKALGLALEKDGGTEVDADDQAGVGVCAVFFRPGQRHEEVW